MLKEKKKCAICRDHRADRFCMRKAKNICWHCCNDMRADFKCPKECEFTPKMKSNSKFAMDLKAYSEAEIIDLFKKEADYWMIKPQEVFDGKSPLEIKNSSEGKKKLEDFFKENPIPSYHLAKIYKDKFNIKSIDLSVYPPIAESFEEKASLYLQEFMAQDWQKLSQLLFNDTISPDSDIFDDYIKTDYKILKKIKDFDILASALSEDKKSAFVHFEINGKHDLLILLKQKNDKWYVAERAFSSIELFLSRSTFYKEIATLLSQNKLKEAYALISRFSNIFIDSADIYYYYGIYYRLFKNFELSLEQFIRAYKMEPSYIPYAKELAMAYIYINNLGEAEKIYVQILNKQKNDIDTINNLATIYAQTNRQKEALKLYEKCLTINPDHEAAKKNIERIKTNLS